MTEVILATPDTLSHMIESAVAAGVARALPGALSDAIRKPYLTTSETMELTGLSRRALAYRRASGSLPYTKRGRTVLFRSEDVYRWIEAGYVPGRRAGGLQ
jgi:excisionase family DNA binding protein